MATEEGTYGRTIKLLIRITNCARGYNRTVILTKQDCLILKDFIRD